MTTNMKHANMVPALRTAAYSALSNPLTNDPQNMTAVKTTPHTTEQVVYPKVLIAVVPALTWRPMMKMLFAARPMKLLFRTSC
jgi:hypothetical protein